MKKRKAAPIKTYLLPVLLLGLVAIIYLYKHPIYKTSVAEAETGKVFYPTLYSDQYITENAKIADARLSNITRINKEVNLANVFSPVQKSKYVPIQEEPERGTWLWTPILSITPEYRDSIISGAKKNGLRTIYVSIDSYLDVVALPEGPEKDRQKEIFDGILEDFVTEAHKAGLSVDAEAGWRNWAERGHEYKAFVVLAYAIDFNKTHTEKLRGFQYDIEPYLLDSYKENKKTVLRNFLNLINETVARMSESDLELSVVIPEFYEASSSETPKFLYSLRYGYTLDHLLNILEQRPGSKIVVMAYRNFALGDNGSIDISKQEVGASSKYQTKVVVAQETGEAPSPSVTFHDTSRAYYDEQTNIIDKTFSKEKAYAGLATHYINAFLTLKWVRSPASPSPK